MLAEGWPAIRQSGRVNSTVEVLPLVPVTAAIVSGKGWKNFAAIRANLRRGSAAAEGTAPSRGAAGADRLGNEILAVEPLPPERAEPGAGCDLAVVGGEAGDGLALATAGQRAQGHQGAGVSAGGGSSADG